ncbi:MAG: anhydro-N-acetylmuramic acid kinase [Nitrospirae bacterium]|nr:anhydro-N-acetylmuramic acid kinase [Nitrospirota bacterium]
MNKTKDLYKIIGLMSGTSHDGLDAALVNINPLKNNRLKIKLIHHIHIPYDAALRNRIHNAFNGTTEQICRLNFELGEVFSQGVLSIIKESNVSYKEIDCVSSHGQTIYHIPPSETTTGCTLQIGESSIIAQRTGIPVISDFRTADMAVGGQGAPLVPMADYILFGKKDKTSAVLNIGGMANVTIVSDTIDKIIAFDTGPGNSLIDEVIRLYSNGEILFDNNGEIAQKGKPEKQLLDTLLSNQYFKKSPPKSTGRELFGLDYAKEILLNNIPIEDIICTLTHLTAITIVDAISPYNPDEIIVTGGGVYNSYLIELMTNGFREKGIKSINKITKYGIPPEAKEAVSFAVLGYLTLNHMTGNVPSATGANKSVILGKFTFP